MKPSKPIVVELPIDIDVYPATNTYTIKYGKIPPIELKDGTKIQLNFKGPSGGTCHSAK